MPEGLGRPVVVKRVALIPLVLVAAAACAAPPPSAVPSLGSVVTRVVDGDTVDVANGQRVRLIGIDTPESGQCGAAEATRAMVGPRPEQARLPRVWRP
jgi:endonuclease YncB( thermonuclease family)